MKLKYPLYALALTFSAGSLATEVETKQVESDTLPPSSFITFGTHVGGNSGDMEKILSSSAGSVNSFGRFGYQISSVGASYVEKFKTGGGNAYVENFMVFKGGANYRYNEYLYPYFEAGFGRTSTEGTRESGTHTYFVSEAGIMARPFKYLSLSAGYQWAATPDEIESINGLSLKAGIFF